MASKRLSEETTFRHPLGDGTTTDFICGGCGGEFTYERDPTEQGAFEEPKFCPVCGRRNGSG